MAIRYQVISETGPAHDKVFDVEVLVEGKSIGQGQGRSKKLGRAGSCQKMPLRKGWIHVFKGNRNSGIQVFC